MQILVEMKSNNSILPYCPIWLLKEHNWSLYQVGEML